MFKRFIGKILYESVGKHLPASSSKLNIGQKRFRSFCAKLIVKSVGSNTNIEKGAYFSHKISIGDNSGIGRNSQLNGCVEIGRDVMMGPECVIYTQNHAFNDLSVPMIEQGFSEERKVIIGNDVWIGGRVIILPGVKIGDHSVIGAGSVVTKDVPSWAIVAGNPATVKKYRNEMK